MGPEQEGPLGCVGAHVDVHEGPALEQLVAQCDARHRLRDDVDLVEEVVRPLCRRQSRTPAPPGRVGPEGGVDTGNCFRSGGQHESSGQS